MAGALSVGDEISRLELGTVAVFELTLQNQELLGFRMFVRHR